MSNKNKNEKNNETKKKCLRQTKQNEKQKQTK